MKNLIFAFLLILSLLSSCDNSQNYIAENIRLKIENDSLKKEIILRKENANTMIDILETQRKLIENMRQNR